MELPYKTSVDADEPLAIQEARDFCNYPNTDRDDLFDVLIKAAREVTEGQIGRQWMTATWVLTLDAFPASPFSLLSYRARPPFQSITSIEYLDLDGDSQTLATTVYDFSSDPESGRVSLAYNQTWPSIRMVKDTITITFVNGYGNATTDVPGWARVLMLEMVLAWWRRDAPVGELTKAMKALIARQRRVA